jgi:hypothetical protein
MTGGRVLKVTTILAACLCCSAPIAAHAAQADDPDDDGAAAQLAQDIGCVATYDVILAAGKGRIKAEESLRRARDAALEAFRQDSDLPEPQVRDDVVQADRMLSSMLQDTHQTLAQYKASCDAAFMANPFADSDAQPL